MPRPHSVIFLAYERFQILDLTGPAAVFASANYVLSREAYAVSVVSPNGGLVASNSGVSFATLALTRMPTSRPDTFLVVGADEPDVRAAMANPTLRRWLPRWVRRAGFQSRGCHAGRHLPLLPAWLLDLGPCRRMCFAALNGRSGAMRAEVHERGRPRHVRRHPD